MPGPHSDPLDSAELSDELDTLVAKGTDAVDSLAAYESAPPPADKTDACADLEAFRDKLQAMIAAVNATMADLGCGQ
jgi:hypothetical protein